jgi:ferredoxin
MAVFANRYPENVAGKFYVDDQCIDCDLCRETAPDNFTRNEDGGYSYVYKQPTSPDEETLCKEAMEGCPVEAIGSDGVEASAATPAQSSPQPHVQ